MNLGPGLVVPLSCRNHIWPWPNATCSKLLNQETSFKDIGLGEAIQLNWHQLWSFGYRPDWYSSSKYILHDGMMEKGVPRSSGSPMSVRYIVHGGRAGVYRLETIKLVQAANMFTASVWKFYSFADTVSHNLNNCNSFLLYHGASFHKARIPKSVR